LAAKGRLFFSIDPNAADLSLTLTAIWVHVAAPHDAAVAPGRVSDYLLRYKIGLPGA
jgi:hypothetical protein